MDNQRPLQEPQNKADLQRDYRAREKRAFDNLLGALNEVERTNARSRRRDILKRATECLRSLGQEQVDLQQQLGEIQNNTAAVILSDEELEFFLQQYLAEGTSQ